MNEEAKRAPTGALWVIVGIIVLTLTPMTVTAAISIEHGVADGYIPLEERARAADAAP